MGKRKNDEIENEIDAGGEAAPASEDMPADDVLAEKVADKVVRRFGAALAAIAGGDAATTIAGALPAYMTVAAYAKHRACSPSTVKRWLKFGLPSARYGRGLVRVKVAEADRWVDSGAATRAVEELGKGAA